MSVSSLSSVIAQQLNLNPLQVEAALQHFEAGWHLSFLAKYRKKEIHHLSLKQLRTIFEAKKLYQKLEKYKKAAIENLRQKDALSPSLEQAIHDMNNKEALTDLLFPYQNQASFNSAVKAKESGLLPLARLLLTTPHLDPKGEAKRFLLQQAKEDNEEALKAVLAGLKAILRQHCLAEPDLIQELRENVWQEASLESKLNPQKKAKAKAYRAYFQYRANLKNISSQDTFQLLRAYREHMVALSLKLPQGFEPYLQKMAAYFKVEPQYSSSYSWWIEIFKSAFEELIFPKLFSDLLNRLKERAQEKTLHVFKEQLQLTLSSSSTKKTRTLGLYCPNLRNLKAAVIDEEGNFLEAQSFSLSHEEWYNVITGLAQLILQHKVKQLALSQGPAAKNLSKLIPDLLKLYPDFALHRSWISALGLNAYINQPSATEEFPQLEPALRAAVSIARRYQNVLPELAKINPQQLQLSPQGLEISQAQVVMLFQGFLEDKIHELGLDLNQAPATLLRYVAGLSLPLATKIVQYRQSQGPFLSREQLRQVPELDEQAFQQAAGFLLLPQSKEPLDNFKVHPEHYEVIRNLLADLKLDLLSLLTDPKKLQHLDSTSYTRHETAVLALQNTFSVLNPAAEKDRAQKEKRSKTQKPKPSFSKKESANTKDAGFSKRPPKNSAMADAFAKLKEKMI